jgi:hypothetical protein
MKQQYSQNGNPGSQRPCGQDVIRSFGSRQAQIMAFMASCLVVEAVCCFVVLPVPITCGSWQMEKEWGILWLLVLLPWCLRLDFDTRVGPGLGWLCCQVGQSGATLCVASRSRQAWSVVGLSFAHVRVGPVFPSFLVYHLPRLLHDNARLSPFFLLLHHPPSTITIARCVAFFPDPAYAFFIT